MRRLFFSLSFCLILLAGPALAEPMVTVDLNKLEPRESACRAYLVLENGTEQAFTAFTLDLYIFGPDGVITKRLAVDTDPLLPNKTRVRPVDIRDTACDRVTKVLLNDVLDCADAAGQRSDCVGFVTLSSHTDAEFIK